MILAFNANQVLKNEMLTLVIVWNKAFHLIYKTFPIEHLGITSNRHVMIPLAEDKLSKSVRLLIKDKSKNQAIWTLKY